MLKKLDELISWTRMKFKPKKCRSCRIETGKAKQVHFSIAGDQIPTVKEQPLKRWYEDTLGDKHERDGDI